MADSGHVHPDLMGAAGLQLQFHAGKSTAVPQGAVAGDSGGPVSVHAPFNDGAWLSTNGQVNGAGWRCKSFYQSQIRPPDLPGRHLSGEHSSAVAVTGNRQKAGGIPVQAADKTAGEGQSFFRKVKSQPIGQGISVVSHGGMNGGAGGLVEYQHILILIDNGKGHRSRRHIGRSVFQNPDFQKVAAGKHTSSEGVFVIKAYAVFRTLQSGQHMMGAACPAQKIPYCFSGVSRGDLISDNSFHTAYGKGGAGKSQTKNALSLN